MNEKQARAKGYCFTGWYSFDKEEMKTKSSEIKAQGFKSVVVTVPGDPLSRGGAITGYSVYVEEAYIIMEILESLEAKYKHFDRRFKEMKERHEEELKNLEEERLRILSDIQLKRGILKDQGFIK